MSLQLILSSLFIFVFVLISVICFVLAFQFRIPWKSAAWILETPFPWRRVMSIARRDDLEEWPGAAALVWSFIWQVQAVRMCASEDFDVIVFVDQLQIQVRLYLSGVMERQRALASCHLRGAPVDAGPVVCVGLLLVPAAESSEQTSLLVLEAGAC